MSNHKGAPHFFLFHRAATTCKQWRIAGLLVLLHMIWFALPFSAYATNHQIRMDVLTAGVDGDANIQFLQMVVNGNTQKDWGPQAGETQSRAMLLFFDANGNQTGEFKFPSDPPSGANTVLIATSAFTNRTGLRADFIIPPLITPGSGKVCFKGNPANPNRFDVKLCLSYGNFPTNLTEGAGLPAAALPVTGSPTALVRFQNFSFGDTTSRNADFRLGIPSATNTAGQRFTFPVLGPEINTTPNSVVFGNQEILLGATTPRTITINNSGTSNSLVITGMALAGPNTNQFRILSDSGQNVLGPGANRTLTVDFDPDTVGIKDAILRILSNDSDEAILDVGLQGIGVDTNPCSAPDPAAAIAKDLCPDAQMVGPGFTYTGSTSTATNDGTASCGNSSTSRDVWFRYVPVTNGILTVSLQGSSFDTVLSAHSGCPGTITNQIVCNDDFFGVQSRIQLSVTKGVEVMLRIAGKNGITNSGNFQMVLTGPPAFDFDVNRNLVNDTCEFDFGDAPAPYPTLLANNGARHRALTGVFLGKRIDPNVDGLPDAQAMGDNLDGPQNDDDGVTFTSPMVPGGSAQIRVVASTAGFLSGWIDFNADGSWGGSGEQVVSNRPMVAGANQVTFNVPASAVVTNRTFARFRFNSTGALGAVTGATTDGEVEDYAVEIISQTPTVGDLEVRFNQIMAGLNGDSSIQFVMLEANGDTNKMWGPQAGESAGRAMLSFFDAAGKQTGRFVFPSNAPSGGNMVLVATRSFAELTGIQPDFVMEPEVMALSGKIVFQANPDNAHFNMKIALSYGGNGYFGLTDAGGPANTNQLQILGAKSLKRFLPLPFGLNVNGAFQLSSPTPSNTLGQTFSFEAAPLIDQGRILFSKETFNGNGRTCQSCHLPGKDQFGLTTATIAALSDDDPLFVFEENVNTLKLTSRSQPGDLRGVINSATGSGKVLAGSGDTYLVIGGTELSGTISDTNGNTGTFQLFTPGNLDGTNMVNGSERGLEDHALLTHGRGLVLENIDGLNKLEVFRASPHLLNLAQTAPYGLSGEFKDLQVFSEGAVIQHFPKSIARVSGVDFRDATPEELQALEAFMNSISGSTNRTFELNHFATTEAQKRGRALFFSDQSKCSKCHNGPVLANADGSISGSIAGINDNFNTGVANNPKNLPNEHNLPTEPAGLTAGESTRKFNTPPLFNIRLTAPYFHDGSAANLTEAVKFYDSVEFVASPAGSEVGAVTAANDSEKIEDLVAFLESLVDLPVGFTPELNFGQICLGDALPGAMSLTITNLGTNTLTITNVVINGTNASDFSIVSDTGEETLAPNASRTIGVKYMPVIQGHKQATLEVTANDNSLLGKFSFGTALTGRFLDNVAAVGLVSLDFGSRSIDDLPSASQTVGITNIGTTSMEVTNLVLLGDNGADFKIISDSGQTNIAPGASRQVEIAFAPKTRGIKLAKLRIESVACSGSLIEVSLTGTATSVLDHFGLASIGSTPSPNTPFAVTLTAQDRNGDTIPDFAGPVSLTAVSSLNNTNSILISEIDPGTPDMVEFVNVSGQSINISGWNVTVYDETSFPNALAILTIPASTIVPTNGIFKVTENGIFPGTFPNFFMGANLFWTGSSTNIGVMLQNAQGAIVDFAGTIPGGGITTPLTVPDRQWAGPGIAATASDDVTSYQRTGIEDNNNDTDWMVALRNPGLNNPGLEVPFPNSKFLSLIPATTTTFTNGTWSGFLTVQQEALNVRLLADDGTGHTIISNRFDVLGSLPAISDLNDLTINEDSPAITLPFTISDSETAANYLTLTGLSSNTLLLPNNNISFKGSETNRTITILPVANQSGTAIVTVAVSDKFRTNSDTFIVVVNPVNDGPVMAAISNRSVNELSTLTLTATTTDVDLPNDVLNFSLLTAPTGASINPTNGAFSWTPTEAQGPGTNLITVMVADGGIPSLTSTQSFTVTTLEVNSAPSLAAISNKTIYAANTFTFTNLATDLDVPTNSLTFSFATAPVAGMTLNTSSGVFAWTPTEVQAPSTNIVRIRVADNGVPSLISTQIFTLTVARLPVNFVRNFGLGQQCVGTPSLNTTQLVFTNSGSNVLTITDAAIVGTNAVDFNIVTGLGQTNFAPGQTGMLEIAFAPQSLGRKQAKLRITANANDSVGSFVFETGLTADFLDNVVQPGVTSLDFGTRSIDAPTSVPQIVGITNNGTTSLDILSMTLTGTNAVDFKIISDSGQTNLASGAARVLQVAFAPLTRGPKVASLRVQSVACSGAMTDVALSGTGTSTLDHYTWDLISSNQNLNVPFNVRITAQDRNGSLVDDFTGTVKFSNSNGAAPVRILTFTRFADTNANEEYTNTIKAIATHFTNFVETATTETNAATLQSLLASKDVFLVVEQETAPFGQMAPLGTMWASVLNNFVFNGGTVIVCSQARDEHQILVNSGLMSLAKVSEATSTQAGSSNQNHILLSGVSVPFSVSFANLYHPTNHNGSVLLQQSPGGNAIVIVRDVGAGHVAVIGTDFFTLGTQMDKIIANAVQWTGHSGVGFAGVAPSVSGSFSNGIWVGTMMVQKEGNHPGILADDGNGHTGRSNPFVVRGGSPTISNLPDLTINEDAASGVIPFTVGDPDTSVTNLLVAAFSSNTNLVPTSNIVLGGNGTNRTITLLPATNQFGVAVITVSVRDQFTTNSDTFVLTVNPINDPPTLPVVSGVVFAENFDGVTAPALPLGWTATANSTGGIQLWRTSTSSQDTLPNSVFLADSSVTSDHSLESPSIAIPAGVTQLSFRHSFGTESCCDGGFVEISLNGGAFNNITTAGGVFVTNAYNSGLSWRGSSAGFITSTVTLPPAAAGQNVRFRWRFTTDSSVPGTGWFVDSISVGGTLSLTNLLATAEDTPVVSSFLINDPDSPASTLVLTGTSSNPTLVPNENIVFTGTNENRTVTIRPATNQFGSTTITITVSDGQTNVSRAISLTVVPVNDQPEFAPIGDQIVNEGTQLTIAPVVTDADGLSTVQAFAILTGPAGSSINPTNGLFTWIPSEAQGPRTEIITLRATDNGSPTLSGTVTFAVIVREVNSAPVLVPISGRSGYAGLPLVFTNLAGDIDIPTNKLTFSLDFPPSGAVINSTNGIFTWIPTLDQLGTNLITVRVTDNGTPNLSSVASIPVTILSKPVIQDIKLTNDMVQIRWDSIPGRSYQVQFKTILEEPTWNNLSAPTITTGSSGVWVDPIGTNIQRFYRIQALP